MTAEADDGVDEADICREQAAIDNTANGEGHQPTVERLFAMGHYQAIQPTRVKHKASALHKLADSPAKRSCTSDDIK